MTKQAVDNGEPVAKEHQLALRPQGALTVTEVRAQMATINELLAGAMKEGEHYGKIPGCGKKDSLFKAGAEKLSMMFRLTPEYEVFQTDLPDGHREYRITCTLRHIGSEKTVGQGVGSCSTLESKYRYREQELVCPKCGEHTIIKGRDEYGGGWICWAKKGGCNAKFKDGDKTIESQERGKVENPDIADTYNTVLKMGKKRAHVDAILTATAASDIFTQDIEDFRDIQFSRTAEPEDAQVEPVEPEHTPPARRTTRKAEPKRETKPKTVHKAAAPPPDSQVEETNEPDDLSAIPPSMPVQTSGNGAPILEKEAAPILSEEKRHMVIATFENFDISAVQLETVLQVEQDKWTTTHRKWLVDRYRELEAGELDKDGFDALEYSE